MQCPPSRNVTALAHKVEGTKEENTLGRVNPQIDEPFGMRKRDLYHCTKLLNLLFAAADVCVSHVGFFLKLG